MISLADFVPTICAAIPRFQANAPNAQQRQSIDDSHTTPLMIVAGPGSGKTTVLVLRALRFVFVDGLMPEQIVLTTFTRKAAQELRARLIEWGLLLKAHLEAHPTLLGPAPRDWLDGIDINRFVTGTLDSLCEEVLTTHRDPTDAAPVLVEQFVGDALLIRRGLFPTGAHGNPDLEQYLAPFTFEGTTPRNFGELATACRQVVDRLIYDQVDIVSFSTGNPHPAGRAAVVNALAQYRAFMDDGNRMDFARLEELFLDRLRAGRLNRFTDGIRALLVDEYQDSNPLQEAIYFELLHRSKASLTVVGDDDQSLYRFRGATVELFRDFSSRLRSQLPQIGAPSMRYLVDNYRSTPEIVQFFNAFITNDPSFVAARVQPPKPPIISQMPSNGIPVLGMFRPNCQTLATDVSTLLSQIFQGTGFTRTVNGTVVRIERDPNGGDFGDAVLLSHSVNEYASAFGNNPPRARLPLLLRDALQDQHGVQVFNPRGQSLRDILHVQQLLGLVLDCIDPPTAQLPHGAQQGAATTLTAEARRFLERWRDAGRALMAANPAPTTPHTLRDFIRAWQQRTSQTSAAWPDEWPVLELIYKIISWIPFLRDDPEGQVHLEAVARCVAQAATYSSYRSSIIHGSQPHDVNSVRHAIRDIFAPLAESEIAVDEEILPHVPRNRFPIMTIHQAKGLEFPLVIVDVSSDYTTNHARQRFRRFPEGPSNVHRLEEDLAPHCPIGALRTVRTPLARTFDDLTRLFYVAYSRAQSVLLLVGCDPCLRYNATIKHVALGWRSDGTWAYKTPVNGRPPAMANNVPMVLI